MMQSQSHTVVVSSTAKSVYRRVAVMLGTKTTNTYDAMSASFISLARRCVVSLAHVANDCEAVAYRLRRTYMFPSM